MLNNISYFISKLDQEKERLRAVRLESGVNDSISLNPLRLELVLSILIHVVICINNFRSC